MSAFKSIILFPVLLASASQGPQSFAREETSRDRGIQLAQVSIEQRVIIRIPAMPSASVAREAPAAPSIRWRESKGPRCLPLSQIRTATITPDTGVTMVVSRSERYRAHFNRACRSADFYSGFYITPNRDGTLCAKRDTMHARNGSACEIEGFSRLIAEVAPIDEHRERNGKPKR